MQSRHSERRKPSCPPPPRPHLFSLYCIPLYGHIKTKWSTWRRQLASPKSFPHCDYIASFDLTFGGIDSTFFFFVNFVPNVTFQSDCTLVLFLVPYPMPAHVRPRFAFLLTASSLQLTIRRLLNGIDLPGVRLAMWSHRSACVRLHVCMSVRVFVCVSVCLSARPGGALPNKSNTFTNVNA